MRDVCTGVCLWPPARHSGSRCLFLVAATAPHCMALTSHCMPFTSHTNFMLRRCFADGVCRGVYPWEGCTAPAAIGANPAAPSLSAEQLLTQLQRRSNELQRATEELQLLAAERARCLQYLTDQHAKIDAALQRIGERRAALLSGPAAPPCSSIAARQPACAPECQLEVQYCEGLLLLLGDRLRKATAQLLAAQQAFTSGGSNAAHAVGSCAMFGESDEEDAVM